jgi:nucleotide-binding universal stress UspA family protein
MTAPYAHIACCVEDSEASDLALAEARRLRDLGPGRLSLVHVATAGVVFSGGPDAPLTDVVAAREASERWLATLAEGVPGAEAVLLDGDPPSAVVAWARDAGADLLVAASHRGLLERILIGSFASHLVRHSTRRADRAASRAVSRAAAAPAPPATAPRRRAPGRRDRRR